jgi:hypothetical protein
MPACAHMLVLAASHRQALGESRFCQVLCSVYLHASDRQSGFVRGHEPQKNHLHWSKCALQVPSTQVTRTMCSLSDFFRSGLTSSHKCTPCSACFSFSGVRLLTYDTTQRGDRRDARGLHHRSRRRRPERLRNERHCVDRSTKKRRISSSCPSSCLLRGPKLIKRDS